MVDTDAVLDKLIKGETVTVMAADGCPVVCSMTPAAPGRPPVIITKKITPTSTITKTGVPASTTSVLADSVWKDIHITPPVFTTTVQAHSQESTSTVQAPPLAEEKKQQKKKKKNKKKKKKPTTATSGTGIDTTDPNFILLTGSVQLKGYWGHHPKETLMAMGELNGCIIDSPMSTAERKLCTDARKAILAIKPLYDAAVSASPRTPASPHEYFHSLMKNTCNKISCKEFLEHVELFLTAHTLARREKCCEDCTDHCLCTQTRDEQTHNQLLRLFRGEHQRKLRLGDEKDEPITADDPFKILIDSTRKAMTDSKKVYVPATGIYSRYDTRDGLPWENREEGDPDWGVELDRLYGIHPFGEGGVVVSDKTSRATSEFMANLVNAYCMPPPPFEKYNTWGMGEHDFQCAMTRRAQERKLNLSDYCIITETLTKYGSSSKNYVWMFKKLVTATPIVIGPDDMADYLVSVSSVKKEKKQPVLRIPGTKYDD